MNRGLVLLVFAAIFGFFSCVEEKEEPLFEEGKEFQPLSIGLFWTYQVEETEYFGENDFENRNYFLRDRIRSSYVNEAKELVFIVERSQSNNQSNWNKIIEYTLLLRNNSLIKNLNNQSVVNLVFPPRLGTNWNGKIYQAEGDDEFEIDLVEGDILRVNQEEFDDKVTKRDVRFEIFQKNIGLTEAFYDVITYCSRNDCLGNQLIDGGKKISMKLVDNGKN
ncbi:hypothetical protein DFQ04_0588 [Algoriphagus boseongensis]|uniref:Lipoprotein n=1 Tax=Algoriphagus boseongensis TaxID=1442587 RepID=A0A4R6T717_9BACT|nr:hypothetical protein [Algoriphagus boseongensis]TDQ18780.1 hypothetical protein DFQ04_0588 [Algoriphagus boseongensis]